MTDNYCCTTNMVVEMEPFLDSTVFQMTKEDAFVIYIDFSSNVQFKILQYATGISAAYKWGWVLPS